MSKIVTLEWSICRRVLDSSDKDCFCECLFRRSLGFGIGQIAVSNMSYKTHPTVILLHPVYGGGQLDGLRIAAFLCKDDPTYPIRRGN